ncbi:MAG: phospholipase D-like domain-containing protein [bacterium]
MLRRILTPGRNCWGIFDVRKTGLLVDARDYYRAFYHAAEEAQRYILITGWQFDSEVELLRGDDKKGADQEVRFYPFLKTLCERNPVLEIYILAWDFSIVYLLTREWFQQWRFTWGASSQIKFHFDAHHPIGASHHQKFVVVDGSIAFVGGMDICSSRWDDRRHLADHPDRRNLDQKPYEPVHDIQSYHIGRAVAGQLVELFKIRWQRSGGGVLDLPPPLENPYFKIDQGISIVAEQVALSQTQGKSVFPIQESIQEIRSLYIDAIHAAERLIYIENQYFSSQAVYTALIERMADPDRSRLAIVIIVPDRMHAFFEEIGMGIAQVKMLRSLAEVASRNGHLLGIFYPASSTQNGREISTYVHAKLLLIDDRFLTVGSANIANRSMGLDSELNVSWEATSARQGQLIRSIRQARIDLLAEHTAVLAPEHRRDLGRVRRLVDNLNSLADSSRCRLQHHKMEKSYHDGEWVSSLNLDSIFFDPEKPIIEENIYELMTYDQNSLFARGITFLNNWLFSKEKAQDK